MSDIKASAEIVRTVPAGTEENQGRLDRIDKLFEISMCGNDPAMLAEKMVHHLQLAAGVTTVTQSSDRRVELVNGTVYQVSFSKDIAEFAEQQAKKMGNIGIFNYLRFLVEQERERARGGRTIAQAPGIKTS